MKKAIIAVLILFLLSANTFAATPIGQKMMYGKIPVVVLKGDYETMGIQYGKALRQDLKTVSHILENFYLKKNHLSQTRLTAQAELFYKRYPTEYQDFLKGVAKGSKLSLDKIKILNAMETLTPLVTKHSEGACAFVSLPNFKTKTMSHLIGRNYDFPPPYDQLSNYLTITVLKTKNTIPTAIIAIAGEIYCPTCINANSLFMELNNGSPSGGDKVMQERQSLLIKMLAFMQTSNNLSELEKNLKSVDSDYSLIVNAADTVQTKSFEYSSSLGKKELTPSQIKVFTSTNFYQNKEWQNIPHATDEKTWLGVTRKNNLTNLANSTGLMDLDGFKKMMDKDIKAGGAVWKYTIYQLIFDSKDQLLFVKINKNGNNWQQIPLKPLFYS